MREIKFRAWDKARKEYWGSYDFLSDETLPRPIRNMVVEQYTGLEDVNGKEIYEGDIVKWRIRGSHGPFTDAREVTFMDGMFLMKDYAALTVVDVKVVGNVHENPELLKEEE